MRDVTQMPQKAEGRKGILLSNWHKSCIAQKLLSKYYILSKMIPSMKKADIGVELGWASLWQEPKKSWKNILGS